MEHPQGPRTRHASEPEAAARVGPWSRHASEPEAAATVGPAAAGADETCLPALREEDHRERRWRLVRDLAVFQGKLLVDGLKDLVLSPISFFAALAGLLFDRSEPGRSFYAVLRWGHGFDRWVNLFGASQRALPPAADPHAPPVTRPSAGEGLDAYVTRLERVLVEQYRRGGLTAKAKDAIDQAIDGLQTRGQRPPPPG